MDPNTLRKYLSPKSYPKKLPKKVLGSIYTYIEYTYSGVLKWGYPKIWLVYFMENPNLKWMI